MNDFSMEKFKDKYRIPSARLATWDYGAPGLYFVTICTKGRESYFGTIEPKRIVETQNFASPDAAGQKSALDDQAKIPVNTCALNGGDIERQNAQNAETQNIADIERQNAQNTETQNIADIERQNAQNTETQNIASLRTVIGNIAYQFWRDIPVHFPFVELDEFVVMPNHVHGILFFNKPEQQDWRANKFGPQSGNLGSVIRGYKAGVKGFATTNGIEFGWQPRFHDRIIRSEKELNRIRQYILDNPEKWHLDKNNPENLLM